MYTHHDTQPSRLLSIIESLERFAEAGIDPAFDAECEELEREFAEIRCQIANG